MLDTCVRRFRIWPFIQSTVVMKRALNEVTIRKRLLETKKGYVFAIWSAPLIIASYDVFTRFNYLPDDLIIFLILQLELLYIYKVQDTPNAPRASISPYKKCRELRLSLLQDMSTIYDPDWIREIDFLSQPTIYSISKYKRVIRFRIALPGMFRRLQRLLMDLANMYANAMTHIYVEKVEHCWHLRSVQTISTLPFFEETLGVTYIYVALHTTSDLGWRWKDWRRETSNLLANYMGQLRDIKNLANDIHDVINYAKHVKH